MPGLTIPETNGPGRCFLLEDQTDTRLFLENIVADAFPALTVVEAGSIHEADAMMKASGFTDVLALALIDLALPDGNGLDIIQKLSRQRPDLPIIVITVCDDDANLFRALSAGAYGYILKDHHPQVLLELLQRLQNGEPPLSPSIARRLLDHFRKSSEPKYEEASDLTAREQETLRFLARGFTVPETAKFMGLSAQTVAGYVKIIYQKLHVSTRAEATREALKRGLA